MGQCVLSLIVVTRGGWGSECKRYNGSIDLLGLLEGSTRLSREANLIMWHILVIFRAQTNWSPSSSLDIIWRGGWPFVTSTARFTFNIYDRNVLPDRTCTSLVQLLDQYRRTKGYILHIHPEKNTKYPTRHTQWSGAYTCHSRINIWLKMSSAFVFSVANMDLVFNCDNRGMKWQLHVLIDRWGCSCDFSGNNLFLF
jgi:hypothetical protein